MRHVSRRFALRAVCHWNVYLHPIWRRLKGHFTPSSFVKDVTGVDNVCERAAVYASHGRLIAGKWAEDGVTTAIAVSDWTVRFDEAGGCNG